MPNLTFKNLRVRTFSLDFLELSWEIDDTDLDPRDYHCYILRSESPMGPFDVLTGPFEDRYLFVDNRVNQLSKWRAFYYKIRSVRKADITDVAESAPISLGAEPDLIAAEIQMRERMLWTEFAGRQCFIFPVRTFGQRCPNCFDGADKGKGFTSHRTRSKCITCYDTGFARGYLSPIQISVQIDPRDQSIQTLPVGETQQTDTAARLPNFPLVKPRDIIVEAENKRWRVVKSKPTERLRSPVHQELLLHEIQPGDIEFMLEIKLDDIMEFEPSPERNFTNPQTLEDFENEGLNSAFAVYGYRRP